MGSELETASLGGAAGGVRTFRPAAVRIAVAGDVVDKTTSLGLMSLSAFRVIAITYLLVGTG